MRHVKKSVGVAVLAATIALTTACTSSSTAPDDGMPLPVTEVGVVAAGDISAETTIKHTEAVRWLDGLTVPTPGTTLTVEGFTGGGEGATAEKVVYTAKGTVVEKGTPTTLTYTLTLESSNGDSTTSGEAIIGAVGTIKYEPALPALEDGKQLRLGIVNVFQQDGTRQINTGVLPKDATFRVLTVGDAQVLTWETGEGDAQATYQFAAKDGALIQAQISDLALNSSTGLTWRY